MKHLLSFVLFSFFSIGYAQDFKEEWKEVIQFELDGKTKSAHEVVDKIYKKAKREKREGQVIKCFFYQSKFLKVRNENAQSLILENLKKEIRNSKGNQKALLNYIYASILQGYYDNNRYLINTRTKLKEDNSEDWKTWTYSEIHHEIDKAFQDMLSDKRKLRETSLLEFAAILEISPYTNAKKLSLYDFLLDKTMQYRFSQIHDFSSIAKNKTLFENPAQFIKIKADTISNPILKSIVELYQENENHYLKSNNPDIDLLQYGRMKKFSAYFQDNTYYFSRLSELEQSTSNRYLIQDIRVEKAQYYYSSTYKTSEKNHYTEALSIIESILNSNENPNAKAEAESIKEKILGKKIALTIPAKLYPNQNYRAFVEFKNVDTVSVNYFKIPVALFKQLEKRQYYYENSKKDKIDKDSLVFDFIQKHKPIKTTTKVLPTKTDHFEYTTELLMDTMDLGNYLLFFDIKNPLGYNSNKAYAYQAIQVTNLDYIEEIENDANGFQVLDRKTGQPVENVSIANDVESQKTNKMGKAILKGDASDHNSNTDLLFTKENDTLCASYIKYRIGNTIDKEEFQAKAMVFFDRAIYRPGQKVYFKGFMIKNKNRIKSVAPFLTVHIIIEDADENELKEFDLQTNEFGSFTGEFDIPKNALTGEFSITIEEPEDYEADAQYYNEKEEEHSFWDYADYNENTEFKFKVEEYKRPTFEITFEKIKENYTVGDTLTIRGNARTLAGSNLTNVKVAYTVSKRITGKNTYFGTFDNYINSETTTDGKGDFKIEFRAADSLALDQVESFDFKINATVTDLNGETRSATSSLKVGRKMLQLDCNLYNTVYREDPKSLVISATTLNNFPIKATGTLTFIRRNQKEYLIRKERFPELPNIDEKEYRLLFPYEAYDGKDVKTEENKVLSLPFDTEKTSSIDLVFLKKFELGNYEIILESSDQNGNLITAERNFELKTKVETASNKSLFTFNQLKDEKGQFVYEIRSVIPNLVVTSRMYYNSKKEKESVIQLKNGYGVVKFAKAAAYENDVQFHFASVWENSYYSSLATVSQEEIASHLEFEIQSMRNKIEPGSTESWSFIVKNSKLQSEVLASMYDSSLDQFATGNWTPEKFRTWNYPTNIMHYTSNWYDNTIRFEGLAFRSIYSKTYIQEPKLQWFGFNFNYNGAYLEKQYLEKFGPTASIPKNAKTVYGVVTDKTGPLPGANVVVNGSSRGTQTDFDGKYQIDVEKGETLIFNFVGMETSAVVVNNSKNIDIRLKEVAGELEQVVVTALGFKKAKSSLSSATSVIVGNDLAEVFAVGAASGIAVRTDTLSNGKVMIRGFSSLKANARPLVIVDGVPMTQEEFGLLNQDEFETISILKDASASALYGTKAAGGAVIITTKKAMKDLEQVKTRTNFNETAFFYPNLTTDSEGRIRFTFTTPESLTKWKLRLFAHNKKAETGFFQADVISQKDLMVMPNMPRFVREKDVINLAVKISNLSLETKTGNAVLLLFDAATNNPIDTIALNTDNLKPFSCEAKQSVVVNWKITIPEGLQGLRYKVIAKSGNVSDGEENILPVMTDKIFVTESIPIWVKGNTRREFTLENLKKNTSATLQNHAVTFEYTSNPVWMALQSLPYLMNYPYECAEQTFAKYYANCIAEKILTGNPKVQSLMNNWKTAKMPESRLRINEELKSIVLAETPWLLDAETDAQKNQRLAILMDLNTLKENNEKALEKIETLLLPSGGFAWFAGGSESRYISQHILSGIGHLKKLFPADSTQYGEIVSKGIPNLDRLFVSDYSKKQKMMRPATVNLNYLYTRSFFLKEYPFSKKCDSITKLQLNHCKTDWLGYSLYEKGLLALVMNRFNETEFAQKIIVSLKETASTNEEIGMYWIENRNGCYWYESSIETQAMLIEAFAEIDQNKDTADAMKVWLIKNKQANNWPTTKSTTEAVYALLYQGNDWTSIRENTKIKIGDEKILTQKLISKDDELDAGYLKIKFDSKEIDSEMATITVDNKTKVPGFGGVYWQYFETLEHIKTDSNQALSIDKKVFKKVKTTNGDELVELNADNVKVGDLLTVRLILKTGKNLEFVHLKDLRASCLEPVDVISGYEWKGNLSYYKSTKDASTNFFFDSIPIGTYVLEYDLRVTNIGVFNNGISTLQSLYAPEFSSHSLNTKITVTQ